MARHPLETATAEIDSMVEVSLSPITHGTPWGLEVGKKLLFEGIFGLSICLLGWQKFGLLIKELGFCNFFK